MSEVILRTGEAEVCRIPCGQKLQAFSMRWNYVIRQRNRWAFDPDARSRQVDRLQQDLAEIGVTPKHLGKLSGIVEVGIPDSSETDVWEARILPWEYILAAASNPYRDDAPILVVRNLMLERPASRIEPKTYAIVETAPGELARHVDFSAERSMVQGSLPQLDAVGDVIKDPTEELLAELLAQGSPDVIHVTGVDNRSGRQLLEQDLTGLRDGLFLATSSGEATDVRAERIAKALTAGDKPPLFIGFNCWDSGARLAPMTLQNGARTAVAFQHTIDDAAAENFFLQLYRACEQTGWDLLTSFWLAWKAIGRYRKRIRGSSIILWSAGSLLDTATDTGIDSLMARGSAAVLKTPVPAKRTADPHRDFASDMIRVKVKPKPRLNYSSIHNNQSLFDELTLWFDPGSNHDESGETVGRVDDIDVSVQLTVGADTYPFRTRLSLGNDEVRFDLANTDSQVRPNLPDNPVGGVRLPLSPEVFARVSERVQANLYVVVTWHDQTIYQHTHSVWLAPIDQWTLNDREIGWLPSFVQPRDPVVLDVIEKAQNYLECLADHAEVSFNGYQSYDGRFRDERRWEGVDRQVRAIWSSLLMQHGLHYINPPPSYAEFTQRIRTPSETVRSGFGTCVDLAVLLASCWEWVEVHPVLFLTRGHVFPGYWRDVEAHGHFLDVRTDELSDSEMADEVGDWRSSQRWVSGPKTYSEIRGFVQRGELVPIESIRLTAAEGYRVAVEAARSYFERPRNRDFLAMIDIVSARRGDGVTPLPHVYSQQARG
ncbi:MAG: hypothetical protein AAFX06_05775 [Planctomycetota bacterium]